MNITSEDTEDVSTASSTSKKTGFLGSAARYLKNNPKYDGGLNATMKRLKPKLIEEFDSIVCNRLINANFFTVIGNNLGYPSINTKITNEGKSFKPYLDINFRVGNETLKINLEQFLAEQIFDGIVPADKLISLPEPLRIAAVEKSLDHIIKAFFDLVRVSVSVTLVNFNNKRVKPNFYLEIENNNQTVGTLALGFERVDGAKWLEAISAVSSVIEDVIDKEDILIPMRYEFGKLNLTQKEALLLDIGDVLILNDMVSEGENPLKICIADNGTIASTWRGDTAVVTNTLEINMNDIESSDEVNIEDAHSAATLEQLNVKLTFDMGSSSISLKDLKKLAPGYSLKLKDNFENLIKVRSGGKCIAYGELVEIGGAVGVRITEMSSGNTR